MFVNLLDPDELDLALVNDVDRSICSAESNRALARPCCRSRRWISRKTMCGAAWDSLRRIASGNRGDQR